LLAEAKRLGAVIHLNAEVTSVDVLTTSVLLASQKRIYADVIIGADGEFLPIVCS
jgi:salicylate hydroxylase